MIFKQHIANYVTGNLPTSKLPLIGIAGLEQGLESESLIILAGMNETDNTFEIEEYFKKALIELKFDLPSKRQAAIELGLCYADEIIEGKLDPIDGVHMIIKNALNSYDFFRESKKFAMDSINFESAYGLYWSYEDLKDADHPWDKNKSNEVLMKEISANMITEIKKWRGNAIKQLTLR